MGRVQGKRSTYAWHAHILGHVSSGCGQNSQSYWTAMKGERQMKSWKFPSGSFALVCKFCLGGKGLHLIKGANSTKQMGSYKEPNPFYLNSNMNITRTLWIPTLIYHPQGSIFIAASSVVISVVIRANLKRQCICWWLLQHVYKSAKCLPWEYMLGQLAISWLLFGIAKYFEIAMSK